MERLDGPSPAQERVFWMPMPAQWTLPDGAVHVFRARLDADVFLSTWEAMLADEERDRARRYRFDRDRMQYIAARGILRILLGRCLGIAPERVAFAYNAHGKPLLADPDSSLYFNVSHSHGLGLFALSRGRAVGIDVERIRPDMDIEAIAERFFSGHERALLLGMASEARREAFFHCWTRKEAYVKGRGQGLTLGLDSFDVSVDPREARLIATRPEARDAHRWRLAALPMDPGFVAAMAVEEGGDGMECWDLVLEKDVVASLIA